MRTKRMVVLGAFALLLGTGAMAAEASAATPANTTVTIRAQGTDLSGRISSPAPNRCANGRTVWVMKQIGARGGGDDIRFAHDTADLSGAVYKWSTGNTGTPGRFYAKVFKNANCRGATSDTVRAQPN